jgi:hypothetical protein
MELWLCPSGANSCRLARSDCRVARSGFRLADRDCLVADCGCRVARRGGRLAGNGCRIAGNGCRFAGKGCPLGRDGRPPGGNDCPRSRWLGGQRDNGCASAGNRRGKLALDLQMAANPAAETASGTCRSSPTRQKKRAAHNPRCSFRFDD